MTASLLFCNNYAVQLDLGVVQDNGKELTAVEMTIKLRFILTEIITEEDTGAELRGCTALDCLFFPPGPLPEKQ